MNDQNTANEWAEPGESTPAPDAVAETPDATRTKNKRKWSTAAAAGIAAACLASGAIGFGIGNFTSHHDGPRRFSEAPGGHFGPDGRGPGAMPGPDGRHGPDGQHGPRPAIQGQAAPGFDDDAMGGDGDNA